MLKTSTHQTYIRPLTMVSGFSFMTFNTLAEGYFDEVSCPKAPYIPWKDRFSWFKSAFRRYNSSIVCLQQVDFGEQISDYLQSIGYLTFYNATTKITPKQTRQGLLLAVKHKEFKILKSQFVYYDQQKQNHQFVFVQLEHKLTNKHLLVFSTHLKAQVDQQEARLQQIKVLSEYISLAQKASPGAALIVTGDLNTQPSFGSYKKLIGIQIENEGKLDTVYPAGSWSLHKIEKQDYLTMEIDHILHSGLNVIGYQSAPNIKQMSKTGLPDCNNPSDHIPLYAIFTFK